MISSRKIGPANGACEKCVACQKKGLLRNVQADTPLGVARSVEDRTGDSLNRDGLAFRKWSIGGSNFGGGHAEPSGLDVHHFDQREIVLVVENRRARELFEPVGSGNVVDVRMGDDDVLHREVMALKNRNDLGDIVAGINNDRFSRSLVAKDGAVALERADRENLMDHDSIITRLRAAKSAGTKPALLFLKSLF